EFSFMTLMSIKRHMDNNNIKKVQDVWFSNIKWLIETPSSDILHEYWKAETMEAKHYCKNTAKYLGPIYVRDLLDFGRIVDHYMCVWQAAEGSEFILSDNCFGAFEGGNDEPLHNFFIVSPRYAIVLVNRLHIRLPGITVHMPSRTSWFSDKLHLYPQAVYVKGPPPLATSDLSPDDVFKYKRIVIPKEDVYKVNSIFLDCRDISVTYKSTVCMLKSLRFYDKVKSDKVLFTYEHAYAILKRKLFNDLNRTHIS
ncbi:hypothetical protein BGZ95_000886, partial [Linnemannia exigua]